MTGSIFESVAAINEWGNEAKLLWLRVRLTGRAQTAYKQLSETARASYADCKKALRERYEPESKKELYLAEFQARRKRRDEDWAAYAEDLRLLADKAFPALQPEAKEQLSLTHYLGQIENQQIAFGVRQRRPKKVDEAVTATLEMESYLQPKGRTGRVAQVSVDEEAQVVAGVQSKQDAVMDMMTQMMARLEKLEAAGTRPRYERDERDRLRDGRRDERHDARTQRGRTEQQRHRHHPPDPARPIICRRCGKEGHYARGCASRQTRRSQGN